MSVLIAIVGALLLGVLGNELFAILPSLTIKIIRITASIEADDRDQAELIYGDLMSGLERMPGKLTPLAVAFGFLFKVALLRRAYDVWRAAWCALRLRVGLAMRFVRRRGGQPNPADKQAQLALPYRGWGDVAVNLPVTVFLLNQLDHTEQTCLHVHSDKGPSWQIQILDLSLKWDTGDDVRYCVLDRDRVRPSNLDRSLGSLPITEDTPYDVNSCIDDEPPEGGAPGENPAR